MLKISDSTKYFVYENVELTKSSHKSSNGYYQTALSPEEAIHLVIAADLSFSYKGAIASTSNEIVTSSTIVPLTSTQTSITTTPNNRTSATFSPFANLSINYAFSSGKPAQNTRKKIEVCFLLTNFKIF